MDPITATLGIVVFKATQTIAPIIADKVECSISTGISLLTGTPDITVNCSLKDNS